MIQSSRRSFIAGLISLVAATAIVRAGSLMPVKALPPAIRYHAISVEEMLERMMGGPAISAALTDFMAFGTGAVMSDENGVRHIPLHELLR